MMREIEDEKRFLTFEEMMKLYEKRPKQKFLWSGIREKTFGLVFGPSKSGKTIFCENLAMHIAMGANEFFGCKLSGIPEKVLFIGLEEHWENRAERNLLQYNSLSEEEKLLINENYIYQQVDFQKMILSDKDWNNVEDMIVESGASLVCIDSITRLTAGKIENADIAGFIMRKLRAICYDNDITLIGIHHCPKMRDESLTMDKIKGSAVFAQESDFAIGINKTSRGNRYMKNVFFRYAPDDDETVKEFEINDGVWLDLIGDSEVLEDEILTRTDRRRSKGNDDVIVGYFNSNPNNTFTTSEAVSYFESVLPIKARAIKGCLSKLNRENKIDGSKHGHYCSINYSPNNNEK